MMWLRFLLFLVVCNSRKYNTNAGPVEGKLNVHVIPHTHDDVGWLKTVDQYYTGLNSSHIQNAMVNELISSVITSLQKNPDRKFTYVEQAFFQRWWRDQEEDVRKITQDLVKNGQLVFTNGGWCMHDEATPHYIDMIDQTALGHRWLKQEFDYDVTTGWQLDPFGHSATHAALLSAEMGFDGLFFGRIDYQDRDWRRKNKECEFIWDASPSLGHDSAIFSGLTGEYGGNYGPPSGFCFDEKCGPDDFIQDNHAYTNYNVGPRIDDWVRQAQGLADMTKGEHIMFTMGSDFQWAQSEQWYHNLDRIIHYGNMDGRVNTFYSSPELYVKSKMEEVQKGSVKYSVKTDDLFPYADGGHQFWTGYFTSRPAFKRYVRDASAYLQTARQILAGGDPTQNSEKTFQFLSEAMGVGQHHDAVSGTEKQHVAFDYAWRIARGWNSAAPAIDSALQKLTQTDSSFFECPLANVSECAFTETRSDFSVVIWNMLGQKQQELVEIPISHTTATVKEVSGNAVDCQVIPSLRSTTNYGPNKNRQPYTLVFEADVPALGFNSYTISLSNTNPPPTETSMSSGVVQEVGDILSLKFNNGLLSGIANNQNQRALSGSQNFYWYKGSVGNHDSGQASGAYIFRPNTSEALPVTTDDVSLTSIKGSVVTEYRQKFNSWVSQRIRVRGAKLEFTFDVGGIPIDDKWGKEVVSRFDFNPINNTWGKYGSVFFTDANGREMLERRTDFRFSWKLQQTEPIAGNYYPCTTGMFIRDDSTALTVLTDAAQSCSSTKPGSLEYMVHRRLLKDDGRGVGEPLNETESITDYEGKTKGQHYGAPLIIRGTHHLTMEPSKTAASVWRPLQDRVYGKLRIFFNEQAPGVASMSMLQHELPANLQLITYQIIDQGNLFVRIGHQFGLGEDDEMSQPVDLDLSTLFGSNCQVTELVLGGTRPKSQEKRFQWMDEEGHAWRKKKTFGTNFTFGPLQIRTFSVTMP